MQTSEVEVFVIKHHKQFAEKWLDYDQVAIQTVTQHLTLYSILFIPPYHTQPYIFHISHDDMLGWCNNLKLLEFVNNEL